MERVIFIDPSGRGGIGHYTYCLAREIVALGLEAVVATSEDWEFRDQPCGITACYCFRGYLTRPWVVRRELQQFGGQDTLAIHWQSSTHPALLWSLQAYTSRRLGGVAWVFTVHNVLPHELGWFDRFFWTRLYGRMDGLIFHGDTSRNRFMRLFTLEGCRWITIPHGEYVFHFENRPSPGPNLQSKTVLFFGNIRPYKGLTYLLRAFHLVRQEVPGARLLVAGQPLEDFGPYQKEIDLLGMGKYVDLQLRYVPNEEVSDIFAQATVVALPYTDVYQSGVLLLAYGAGIPVVASRVGDLAKAVIDGETGVLVSPGDVPALRDALVFLLSRPELCREMGRKAKELADREYHWGGIAKRTVEFYRTLRPSRK